MTRRGSSRAKDQGQEEPEFPEYLQHPNIARVWSYAAGGKDEFAPDRKVVESMNTGQFPNVLGWMARANHQFLLRALIYLVASHRMQQFLVLGPGIPPDGIYIHDTVQRYNPSAKVVYVDTDRIVLTRARGAFNGRPGQQLVVDADIFDPKALLADEEVTTFLDFSKPIAIICTAVLHYYPGTTADVADLMQTYLDAVPVGSCTVLTHFLDFDENGWDMQQFADALFVRLHAPVHCRTIEEIAQLFPDQDLMGPGVVPCLHWPHEEDDDPPMITTAIAGGIGKKTGP
ncbi:SAM-dependent methyltransferase [Kribbella sp. NPDC055110]